MDNIPQAVRPAPKLENTFGIKPWLWEFAEGVIEKYNIDESHGLRHFVNTAANVKIILEEFKDVQVIASLDKKTETELLVDAGFAHDLVDAKYVNESEEIDNLSRLFRSHCYPESNIDIIIRIITTMSFSKRVARQKSGLKMIEDGPLALATAIVVDADQLDGFDTERCRVYQEVKFAAEKFPNISAGELTQLRLSWRRTILEKRVLLYKDVYMNTGTGKKLAEPLHNNVIAHINKELKDSPMFEYP